MARLRNQEVDPSLFSALEAHCSSLVYMYDSDYGMVQVTVMRRMQEYTRSPFELVVGPKGISIPRLFIRYLLEKGFTGSIQEIFEQEFRRWKVKALVERKYSDYSLPTCFVPTPDQMVDRVFWGCPWRWMSLTYLQSSSIQGFSNNFLLFPNTMELNALLSFIMSKLEIKERQDLFVSIGEDSYPRGDMEVTEWYCREYEVGRLKLLDPNRVSFVRFLREVTTFVGSRPRNEVLGVTCLGKLKMDNFMRFYSSARIIRDAMNKYNDVGGTAMDDNSSLTTVGELRRFVTDNRKEFDFRRSGLVDKVMRARHDIFSRMMIDILDLDGATSYGEDRSTSKTDVDLVMTFGYKGAHSNLTPDCYVLDDYNKIHWIVEFGITSRDGMSALRGKVEKYTPLIEDLEALYNYRRMNHGFFGDKFKGLDYQFKLLVVIWELDEYGVHRDLMMNSYMEGVLEQFMQDPLMEELEYITKQISKTEGYKKWKEDLARGESSDSNRVGKDRLVREVALAMANCVVRKDWKIPDLDNYKSVSPGALKTIKLSQCKFILEEQEEALKPSNMKKVEEEFRSYLTGKVFPKHVMDFLNYDRQKIEETMRVELEKAEKLATSVRTKMTYKQSKFFKLPYLDLDIAVPWMEKSKVLPYGLQIRESLDDGTFTIGSEFFNALPENRGKECFYSREGIGSLGEDLLAVESLVEHLSDLKCSEHITLEGEGDMEQYYDSRLVMDFQVSRMYEIMTFWEDLAENIAYLEGRRKVFTNKKSVTVGKAFKYYYLSVRKGCSLKSDKQINFRVFYSGDIPSSVNTDLFHSFSYHPLLGVSSTKWLTISISDLQHYLKIRRVGITFCKMVDDLSDELNKQNMKEAIVPDKWIYWSLLMAMEHKRGTSTSLQLNRYIFHGFTAMHSNQSKLCEDIFKDPVRSVIESAVRQKQFKWAEMLMDYRTTLLKERMKNSRSTDPLYDRVKVPSFFTGAMTEFSFTMNELYTGYLFNKSMGFNEIRTKLAIKKMALSEMKFQEMKSSLDEIMNKPLKEFLGMADTPFTFSREFVRVASKGYFSSESVRSAIYHAMAKVVNMTVRAGMKLKSSLVAGPMKANLMKEEDRVRTEKAFISLFDIAKKRGTPYLLALIEDMGEVEGVFSLFPKAQVGGPREISIQEAHLRVFMLFMEHFLGEVSKVDKRDMLGNDSIKEVTQVKTLNEYKQRLLRKPNYDNRGWMVASMNSDSSGWAPNFIMEHFLIMICNMGLPKPLEEIFLATISHFCNKRVLTPEVLKEKWERKPLSQVEEDAATQWYREQNMDNNGYIYQQSSMGQGMIHKGSNLYHLVIDEFMTTFTRKMLFELHNVEIEETVLITSDDKTKIMLLKFPTLDHLVSAFKTYIAIQDGCSRLGNIHINMKKSALQLFLTEFNSLFSIGKRSEMALIKDIYTGVSDPDYTSPDEAVQHVLGNIRRCLEHGAYLPTLKVMLDQMRKAMMKAYRFTEGTIQEAMDLFRVNSPALLPYQLGFIPTDLTFETLMFGPDIHMFKKGNTKELEQFYRGLYTACASWDSYTLDEMMLNLDAMSGKFRLELPTRLDKKVLDMKMKYFRESLNMPPGEVLVESNNEALMMDKSMGEFERFLKVARFGLLGVSRKYEFQETVPVHSKVRALSMSTKSATIHPVSKEYTLVTDFLKVSETLKRSCPAFEDQILQCKKKLREMSHDIISFSKFIICREALPSSLFLLKGYSKIIEANEQIMDMISRSEKKKLVNHRTVRSLRCPVGNIGFNITDEELVFGLLTRSPDVSSRVHVCISNLLEGLGLTMDSIQEGQNVFTMISSLVTGAKFPLKNFMDYCKFFRRTFRFNSFDMLAEFPCQGNMLGNMLNMYRYKSSPKFVYVGESMPSLVEEDLLYLSYVSMGIENEYTPIEYKGKEGVKIEPRDYTIFGEDRKPTMTRKIAMQLKDNEVWSKFYTQKLMFNKGDINGVGYKSWIQGEALGLEFNKSNNYYYAIFSKDEVLDESTCQGLIRAMCSDVMTHVTPSHNIVWLTQRSKMMGNGILMYAKGNFKMGYDIVMKPHKWVFSMNLITREQDHSLFFPLEKKDHRIRMFMFTDSYTISAGGMSIQGAGWEKNLDWLDQDEGTGLRLTIKYLKQMNIIPKMIIPSDQERYIQEPIVGGERNRCWEALSNTENFEQYASQIWAQVGTGVGETLTKNVAGNLHEEMLVLPGDGTLLEYTDQDGFHMKDIVFDNDLLEVFKLGGDTDDDEDKVTRTLLWKVITRVVFKKAEKVFDRNYMRLADLVAKCRMSDMNPLDTVQQYLLADICSCYLDKYGEELDDSVALILLFEYMHRMAFNLGRPNMKELRKVTFEEGPGDNMRRLVVVKEEMRFRTIRRR